MSVRACVIFVLSEVPRKISVQFFEWTRERGVGTFRRESPRLIARGTCRELGAADDWMGMR